MKNLNDILNRLKEKLTLKTDTELAELLNLSGGVISNWKARDKIPYNEIFSICENENLDINYIFYNKKEEKIVKEDIYKNKLLNEIDNLNEKECEYFYYLLKSKILEKELNK